MPAVVIALGGTTPTVLYPGQPGRCSGKMPSLWRRASASWLWQVPVGDMAQNNTCDHYQDNRAAYLFRHRVTWSIPAWLERCLAAAHPV